MVKYFVYSADHGFSTHDTAEEAKNMAEELLGEYREDSHDEGWSEGVESVCWGEISQYAKMVRCGTHPDQLRGQYPCDYVLTYKK